MAPVLAAMATAGAVCAGMQFLPALTGIPPLMAWLTPRHTGADRAGQVALTFDDGPHPHGTSAILDVLSHKQCQATFFVVGEQAVRYPEVVRRAHDEGHGIGVHGWDHRPAPFSSPRRIAGGIRDTAALVGDLTGSAPLWYRPPYGVGSGPALAAAKYHGMEPVWWTHWGRDWDRDATVTSIVDGCARDPGRTVIRGRTILLHDSDSYGRSGSWRLTSQALPSIVDAYQRLGMEVGAL